MQSCIVDIRICRKTQVIPTNNIASHTYLIGMTTYTDKLFSFSLVHSGWLDFPSY